MDIILRDITIIFAVSTIVLLICAKIKIPGILGYLITGLLIGPNGLGFISNTENVAHMAEIGVILLLFTIGLEFSLKQLLALKRSALGGGMLQVLITSLFITLLCKIMGLSTELSIFIGMIIAPSSTAIVLKLLMERGEVESPYGRISTSVLIFQDIAVIPMMLIARMLAPGNDSSVWEIVLTLGNAVIVVILLFAAARFIVPKLLVKVTNTRSREVFLFSIILICVVVAVITNKAGLSLALGAFLAGMVVSETGYGYQALGNVIPFKDVFTGFFFISIGMMINMETFITHPAYIIFLSLIVIFVKTLVTTMAINILGYSIETSLKTGLALAQVGEFSFILATTGLMDGIFNEYQNSLFITIAVISMMATPFMMQFSSSIVKIVSKLPLPENILKGYFHDKKTDKKIFKDHIIIVGFGLTGRMIAKAAIQSDIEYIVIEMNPNTVHNEKQKGTPIFYGDASQEEILEHASIKKARSLVISGADFNTTKNIVEIARRLNPTLIIIARTRFQVFNAKLKELGASEVISEEVESAASILSVVFKHYYIPDENIAAVEAELRQEDVAAISKKHQDKKVTTLGIKGLSVETITVPVGSTYTGQSIRAIDPRFKYNVNIIAIKSGVQIKVSPGSDDKINDRDELLVTGKASDIAIFASVLNNKIEPAT